MAVAMTALVAVTMLSACSSERSDASVDLETYQWKNRLLLIFAPSERHPALRELEDELRDQKAGVLDRDLIVITAAGSGAVRIGGRSASGEGAGALRDQFEVPTGDYTVILIGKDGGEKLRGGAEVRLAQVFRLIDAMPMRRRELNEREQP
jgi:hypothetical protein